MKRKRVNKRYRLLVFWAALVLLTAAGIIGFAQWMNGARPEIDWRQGITSKHTSKHKNGLSDMKTPIRFDEMAKPAGIDFQHFPAERHSLIVEDMGSGAAWGDYDNDGDDDLFLVNSMPYPEVDQGHEKPSIVHALYRNQNDGTFKNVSRQAHVDSQTLGMGAAWGDYNNDGRLDLYLTNYGPNKLFRNNGDGTFTEVASQAGVDDARFGSGCAWGDYNRDGWIDLYVCNYVDFHNRPQTQQRVSRFKNFNYPYTLNPSSYRPQVNVLYLNNQDGTFTDVAQPAGVLDPQGRSLGATWTDFDRDGWLDLYVANDVSQNRVFLNRGDGTFADVSADSLAADYRGAMGMAVGDYDRDGDFDLVITHWLAQENAFYENMLDVAHEDPNNRFPLLFMDRADELGIGQISLDMVGWSTAFGDFDNDTDLDLWVANGHTLEREEDRTQLIPQRMLFFWQKPNDGFYEIGSAVHPVFQTPIVARGGAQADYDGDGRLDFIVTRHGGAPLLLRNQSRTQNHWLALRLRQEGKNTQALGAVVTLRAGGTIQTAQIGTQGNYLSQNSNELHFGLGALDRAEQIVIQWPDGQTSLIHEVKANQRLTIQHSPDYSKPVRSK